MNWLFGKNDKLDGLTKTVTQLAVQLAQIKETMANVSEKNTETILQQTECTAQLAKLTRIQYKSGQETQDKLNQLCQEMSSLRQQHTEHMVITDQLPIVTQQRDHLLNSLLCQLDDIDTACSGFKDNPDSAWQPLLELWSARVITTLAEIGIHELHITGTTFQPQTAEAVGTVARPTDTPAAVPYEIAEVIKRGFTAPDGTLLRQAQVITYKEEEYPI